EIWRHRRPAVGALPFIVGGVLGVLLPIVAFLVLTRRDPLSPQALSFFAALSCIGPSIALWFGARALSGSSAGPPISSLLNKMASIAGGAFVTGLACFLSLFLLVVLYRSTDPVSDLPVPEEALIFV